MGLNHPNRGKISADKWPDYLRRFREKHNLSQADLGDHLMISKRLVENWEGKLNEPPTFLKLALKEVERRILQKQSESNTL